MRPRAVVLQVYQIHSHRLRRQRHGRGDGRVVREAPQDRRTRERRRRRLTPALRQVPPRAELVDEPRQLGAPRGARVRHVSAPLRQEASSSPQCERNKSRVDERGVPLARRLPARHYQPPPPQRPRRRDVEGRVVLRPSQNAIPAPPRATLLQAQQRRAARDCAAVERREARPSLPQARRAHAPAQQRDAPS